MKLVFLGVGEAFDERNPNNSALVLSEAKLLLDCGFLTPFQLWKYNSDQNMLDGVFISHGHADHYFGLPALLLRMWEEKRTREFEIICQKGMKKQILEMMEIAYRGFMAKFAYSIKFTEVSEGEKLKFKDLVLEFAHTEHSSDNLAIKLSNGKKSFCYSGDGMFNEKTEKLYENSDLVIQETYLYDEKKIGHACIKETIEMAERRKVKTLALTHINRVFRKNEIGRIRKELAKEKVRVIVPEAMDEMNV